jgi:hypothetical protein
MTSKASTCNSARVHQACAPPYRYPDNKNSCRKCRLIIDFQYWRARIFTRLSLHNWHIGIEGFVSFAVISDELTAGKFSGTWKGKFVIVEDPTSSTAVECTVNVDEVVSSKRSRCIRSVQIINYFLIIHKYTVCYNTTTIVIVHRLCFAFE